MQMPIIDEKTETYEHGGFPLRVLLSRNILKNRTLGGLNGYVYGKVVGDARLSLPRQQLWAAWLTAMRL
jgi:hypothetical protein